MTMMPQLHDDLWDRYLQSLFDSITWFVNKSKKVSQRIPQQSYPAFQQQQFDSQQPSTSQVSTGGGMLSSLGGGVWDIVSPSSGQVSHVQVPPSRSTPVATPNSSINSFLNTVLQSSMTFDKSPAAEKDD